MKLKIIYETADYLVVDKPSGLVVNKAESIKSETVQDWAEQQVWYEVKKNKTDAEPLDSEEELFIKRSGVCHRLDKETSGCLLLAKNPRTLVYFLDLFKRRKVKKRYLALVHGRVEPRFGEVVLPMRRSPFLREKWQVRYDGKRAVSSWLVEKYYDFLTKNSRWKDTLSLLSVGLKTGRTHQIRVHFSFLGWPLFSDEKYLQKEQSDIDRKMLNRHFLHAMELSFIDNLGNDLTIKSELPDDFKNLLSGLSEKQ